MREMPVRGGGQQPGVLCVCRRTQQTGTVPVADSMRPHSDMSACMGNREPLLLSALLSLPATSDTFLFCLMYTATHLSMDCATNSHWTTGGTFCTAMLTDEGE